MKPSIRKFLLINLLLAIFVTTALTTLGNYYLDQKHIQYHLKKYHSKIQHPYNNPSELGHQIAQDELFIIFCIFPLSGILIWIIIGRGLRSLRHVAEEVANRAPNHLDPVILNDIPEEIAPVINELNDLFYRLKEGFDREQRFAADAAHELRTPLAAIKTLAQVALNASTIEEKNDAIHKLITNLNRSTHVVQQLLTISKLVPEANSSQNNISVNLAKITPEILAMLAPTAIENQIELAFEANKSIPCITGNPIALGILIRNLVDNAIRYSHPNGQVLVRVYPVSHDVVLEITDTGPGIPPELQSRVFERFYRILGTKSLGSGLGLAIVQQICHLHHARIILGTPARGTGLSVKVFFPASS